MKYERDELVECRNTVNVIRKTASKTWVEIGLMLRTTSRLARIWIKLESEETSQTGGFHAGSSKKKLEFETEAS